MVVGASGRACTYLGEGKGSRVQWAVRWHVKQAHVVGERGDQKSWRDEVRLKVKVDHVRVVGVAVKRVKAKAALSHVDRASGAWVEVWCGGWRWAEIGWREERRDDMGRSDVVIWGGGGCGQWLVWAVAGRPVIGL